MYSEEEARELMELYIPRFFQCVMRGLGEYQGNYAGLRANVSRRSDSSNRCDFIWVELEREFEDEQGVGFTNRRNRRLMHVRDDFNLRVKKLDSRMRPVNNITQTVLDFLDQHVHQPRLPGMEPPTSVDLAYQLTGIAEEHVDVYLRCPNSRRTYEWLLPLGEAQEIPEIERMAPVEPDTSIRVRLRSEEAQSGEGESSETSSNE